MLQRRSPRLLPITHKRFNLFQLKKIASLAFIPFVIFTVVLIIHKLQKIKTVECQLNQDECPASLSPLIVSTKGSSYIFLNHKEIRQKITQTIPDADVRLSYSFSRTLSITITSPSKPININISLVEKLPLLSMDNAPSTTDSAMWWTKPSVEFKDLIPKQVWQSFTLQKNGSLTSSATTSSSINMFITVKPEQTQSEAVYRLSELVEKYLTGSSITILDNRAFLSRPDLPDIIVNVPFDEKSLVSSLHSLNYLVTIKKDARVIDLSFKNPIIR